MSILAQDTAVKVATAPQDTSSQSMKGVYYAPKYSEAFPDSSGCDIQQKGIATLPIMEVPIGKAGIDYVDTPFKSGGTMMLLVLSFLFIAFSFRNGAKYFNTLVHNLFSVKKQRNNMFDDHTVNESQMLTSLIVNTSIITGVLLFFSIYIYIPDVNISKNIFYSILMCVGISIALYGFQYITYFLLGYVFDDRHGTKLWTQGYNALISIVGIALAPITLIMLIYPNTAQTALLIALIIYILARIVFICKGFRIFFNNFPSIPYFILYLCNVEIVPIILSYIGAIFLCKMIDS